MAGDGVALLLDCVPRAWSTQEDRHLKICQALAAAGARPVLVFSEDFPEPLKARFREGGADIVALNYGSGARHYLCELGRVVERFGVTTAHVCFFDYFSAVPWLARLRGVRHIVYDAHNSGIVKARSWRRALLQLRTRIVTFPVTRVIAISEFVKRQLVEAGLADRKIVVRYLGIDVLRFTPDPGARQRLVEMFGLGAGEIILTTLAYLRPFKHPQTIIQATGLLARRGIAVRLFVGGDGPLKSDLEQLAGELGVADRIHWLGHCPDPLPLLQASDIFVLASVGEAFGLVLAEAMACGVPVVGSRSGAIGELVEDGRTGLLATPLDAGSFASAIEKLIADPARRRAMGLAGLERVRRRFTVEREVQETMRIYEDLWGGGSGRPSRSGRPSGSRRA
jgi:glycosyltransferase involved in cell wall biosynthesis